MKHEETVLFTPREKINGEWFRHKMQISLDDAAAYGQARKGWVTDLVTGKTYMVRSAACGLNCHCDAIATAVV